MVKYIFVLLLASFVSKLNSQNFILNQALSDSLPNVKTNSIKIIDLNRDGYNDVILSGYDASRYGVYLDIRYGTNDGQLSSGLEYEFITYPDTIGEFIGRAWEHFPCRCKQRWQRGLVPEWLCKISSYDQLS